MQDWFKVWGELVSQQVVIKWRSISLYWRKWHRAWWNLLLGWRSLFIHFLCLPLYTCLASHRWPQSHSRWQILCLGTRVSICSHLFHVIPHFSYKLPLASVHQCSTCSTAMYIVYNYIPTDQLRSNFKICQKKKFRWGSEPQPLLAQLEEWPGSKSNYCWSRLFGRPRQVCSFSNLTPIFLCLESF